jgi:hypothetical protein
VSLSEDALWRESDRWLSVPPADKKGFMGSKWSKAAAATAIGILLMAFGGPPGIAIGAVGIGVTAGVMIKDHINTHYNTHNYYDTPICRPRIHEAPEYTINSDLEHFRAGIARLCESVDEMRESMTIREQNVPAPATARPRSSGPATARPRSAGPSSRDRQPSSQVAAADSAAGINARLRTLETTLSSNGTLTEEDIQGVLTCPITHQIFATPVMATDGHVYEKAALQTWLETNTTSPLNPAATNSRERLRDVRPLMDIISALRRQNLLPATT